MTPEIKAKLIKARALATDLRCLLEEVQSDMREHGDDLDSWVEDLAADAESVESTLDCAKIEEM